MNILLTQTFTPEDMEQMPGLDLFELVDGRLVEKHMGWESSWISTRLSRLLDIWCDTNHLGWVAGAEAGYQCFPFAPNLVRKPDVSFVRRGRLPGERFPPGNARIVPDLAVEVVSPNDTYYEVERKVQEYLRAGVPLVWVVNPPTRMVRVHRPGGRLTDLDEHQELTGEEVIPGFRCRVGDFLPPVENGSSPAASSGETEPTPAE
jgi:Uma2 family endonuclease